MNKITICLLIGVFIILIFPIFIFNYVYVDTEEKYASLNVTLFRFFRIVNINTVKNSPSKMQLNGKEKSLNLKQFNTSYIKILKSLYIHKIVQLGDFGLLNEKNNYIALCQHTLTNGLKTLCLANGKHINIKNFIILNQEHGYIRYYAKAVTAVNLLIVAKIIFILLMEKINERKTQKK